ncbi:hypothetical protein M409DRAFT_20761 [Zasmidium cellare ATCC 36951]|uniref:Enoyl-CoA hydratase n=1 Tax=Zasmidium cellare ATCC 36951 TaxID=1080233 RepID=A0A6A6CPY8_ZASCE|nr:uncharacterized protein M409DRAFT_20761 [Zasmidium cellare ATCC 36951]KAF2168743.1 hypothetical protein M409DRAFT_20761 [Zasmidium cellare ATCC 36951]
MANITESWELERDDETIHMYRHGVDVKVVLARPKKGNVLTTKMVKDLTAIYKQGAKDQKIFRILLTAEGKYFCAGMDLGAEGGVLDDDQEAKQRQWTLLQNLFEAIDTSPKVTIALINGPAFGAGIGLEFACDIRIAAEDATFNISEAKVGLTPAAIMKWVLREWGVSRGREAMLTARPVKAGELVNSGVIHAVVHDAAGHDAAVEEYLRYLDACGPEALAAIKKITRQQESERNGLIKSTYDSMMKPSSEARHGVQSFHERRAPNWQGYHANSKGKL